MKFIIKKASDFEFKEVCNIGSVADLKRVSEKYHERLIIDFDRNIITIYDEYVE